MKFGLMFFASSEEALSGNKYRVVMESARFADENGFASVWLPERHFTELGSLYPNPAVLHAALAASTSRVRLLAGSVVAPLHHPIRIAEEWSMVDNLSNGRVGISFASGWNPDDFAFCPEKYASRQDEMFAGIETVQHLWRGGTIEAASGNGNSIRLRIYPTPVQRELPTWLTAAGNPKTFARAGEMGANLLTHLLDQDEDQLKHKIGLYREARARHGWDPKTATVTVMLHTFVGKDAALVREQARAPFCNYIRGNIGLLNGLAQSRGQQVDVRSMPARELDDFVQFLYERFAQSRGLIGTPESCLALVGRLEAIGVDEIACLLDFGPSVDLILENLPHLLRLQDLYRAKTATPHVRFDPAAVQARCAERISGAEFNEEMRRFGIQIEGDFLGVKQVWRRPGEALGQIDGASSGEFAVHPAFLDACSRLLAAAIDRNTIDSGAFYLPSGLGSFCILHPPETGDAWSHAILRPSADGSSFEGDVRVYDLAGRILIEIEGLRLQRVDSGEKTQDFAPVLYRRAWKQLDPAPQTEAAAPGEWLILDDRGGLGARVAALLEKSGNLCTVITVGEPLPHREYPWKGVLHFGGMDRVLELVKGLGQSRLWLVTSGAMPVLDGEAPAVAQAPLWGLGRAVAVEHPASWGGLIDLDPGDLSAANIVQAVQASGHEDMVAFRQGRRYVARIVRDDSPPAGTPRVRFEKDATYLITGGTGGLGARLTSWLLARGAGHIALLGRSVPDRKLEPGVRFFKADVSSYEDTAEALREIGQTMPPLKGIFHLAGVLDDALLVDQDAERFHRAGTAKIDGAWHLHQLTAEIPLDRFVMFSSMASLITMPGQGNYAAANSFLDALAHLRRAEGKAGLSVNWGPWAEIGHAATEYGRRAHERLATLGVDPLPPEFALAALESLMQRGATQAGVAQVNWVRLFEADPAAAAAPLLSEFSQPGNEPAPQETKLAADLRSCAPGNRRDFVVSVLAGMLAEVLRLPDKSSIARGRSLFDLGLDSILALELTSRISAGFGRPFRATLFFTHPTLEAITDHILHELELTDNTEELSEDELSELIAQEIGRA